MTSRPARSDNALWPALRLWLPWLAIRAVGVVLLLQRTRWYPNVGQDMTLYGGYGHAWTSSHLPYRDFHIEYPPGILPLLRLPAGEYVASFVLLALLADAVAQRHLWHQDGAWGGTLWLVAPVALGPLFWSRLDVFVAALLVVGITAARSNRWLVAGCCLSYAGMLKLWPFAIAVAAVFVAERAWRRAAIGVVAPLVLIGLPVIAYGGAAGLVWMLRYQTGHGVEVESVAAAPVLLIALFGHTTLIGYGHGSVEFVRTGLVRALSILFDVSFWASMCVVGAWWIRKLRRNPDLGPLLLVLVAAMFLTSTILSAQYVLWGLAAVVVCIDRVAGAARKYEFACWTIALLATTQLEYPFALRRLTPDNKLALAETLLHAVVVIGFVARAASEAVRLPRPVDLRGHSAVRSQLSARSGPCPGPAAQFPHGPTTAA